MDVIVPFGLNKFLSSVCQRPRLFEQLCRALWEMESSGREYASMPGWYRDTCLNHCSVLCATPTMQYLSCICNDLGPSQRLMFNVPPQSAAMRGALGSAHDFLRLVARLACSGGIKASPAEYMYFVQGPPEDFLTPGTNVKYTWSIKVCLDFPYTFLTKSDPSLYRPESVRNILNKAGPVMCHGS